MILNVSFRSVFVFDKKEKMKDKSRENANWSVIIRVKQSAVNQKVQRKVNKIE